MGAKSVVVYSQASCPPCHALKEWLTNRGVPFTDKDVSADPQAARELTETHRSMSTPTIVIDGKVFVGFQKDKIEAAL